MKEIVTIQVGGFSNFIGSHFWNFQDELLGFSEDGYQDSMFNNTGLDFDTLYRLGETYQGRPTYSPRLLAIDSRGSFGAVRPSGSIYEETSLSNTSSVLTWGGRVSHYVSEPYEKNLFLQSLEEEENGNENANIEIGSSYDQSGTTTTEINAVEKKQQDRARIECLENGVQKWTDFSKVQFHPLSLYEVQGLWKDIMPFDDFGNGRGILAEPSQAEELSNRLHFFVEECDHIQGFQFLVDDSGGFASIATDFMEAIVDEYEHTPIIMYAARDPNSYTKIHNIRSSTTRALHDAISFAKLSSFSGLTVPMGLSSLAKSRASRFLSINDSKLFHTSAVYASALHSTTLPFRMQASGPSGISAEVGIGSLDMEMMIKTLSQQSRERVVAILDAAIPAPPVSGVAFRGILERSMCSLTPNVADNCTDEQGIESVVIQGALLSGRGDQASVSEVRDSMFGVHQGPGRGLSIGHLSVSQCSLPIPLPFPRIFGDLVGKNGEILSSPLAAAQGQGALDVFSIPLATRLRYSKAIQPFLETRLRDLQNLGIARGSPGGQLLETWGLQQADVEDLRETLSEMVLAFDGTSTEGYSDSD